MGQRILYTKQWLIKPDKAIHFVGTLKDMCMCVWGKYGLKERLHLPAKEKGSVDVYSSTVGCKFMGLTGDNFYDFKLTVKYL